MGKWTDKLYITHSEWSGEVGQHSAAGGITGKRTSSGFKKLPFYCCSLSLQPFEHPVCTPDGIIFDLVNIIPYIKQYGTNPVTGEKLETKQLIKLKFFKNDKDEYYCPVTYKVFTDHTTIAAIKTTGNVYAYDTIEKLNIKAKHWKDLLTDESFTRKDIIMLQDPHNLEKRDMSNFDYLKMNKKVINKKEELEKQKTSYHINVEGMGNAKKVFEALEAKNKQQEEPTTAEEGDSNNNKPVIPVSFHQKKKALPYNAAHYTTGEAAESFTSTAMGAYTQATRALIDEDEFMYKKIKSKSYARINTNYGNINIELFSDKVPRTCHNFVQLAKSGYYNGVIFHRNIKNFMIQGGDPTGTGRGGESIWKRDFPDEIKSTLKHDARGVLSMANKGKDTNSSQFFITYCPTPELDGKHTVFGKVVGGMDVLRKLEAVPVDKNDRPEREIVMKQVEVFVDPFAEYQARLKRKLEHEANKDREDEEERRKREKEEKMGWFGPSVPKSSTTEGSPTGPSIGKYLKASASEQQKKRKTDSSSSSSPVKEDLVIKKPKTASAKSTYGNFDNF
ncbi:peptidyl-prolyl cis-trans isomerase-like 2 [Mycotypha africana]|uniref:peptidyl-prolyl cis-trans isomerase-like 2 n=1 Tax=Mycotypha africana TaxID=64632 RepID=UPI0023008FE6|nr:peptidyl-prolyl cis-trans isomerase-like 2 [Mycotypha africana]KAI8992094.1 peptidyl-prolyl cis-trans isomerase-like 2 [Mycotypha africana]